MKSNLNSKLNRIFSLGFPLHLNSSISHCTNLAYIIFPGQKNEGQLEDVFTQTMTKRVYVLKCLFWESKDNFADLLHVLFCIYICTKQESPPAGNRKRRTAFGITCPSVTCPTGGPHPGGGGVPQSWPVGVPHPDLAGGTT